MEDSDFFLGASEISIQALLLVATHSQDISTPSLCWTLISNACRMAQTPSLHLPNAHAPKGSEANLQRNCLFWSLFIIDKSISLSFGRPPMLPGYLYKDFPPPDSNLLAKYRPHQDLKDLLSFNKSMSPSGEFGAVYITQHPITCDPTGQDIRLIALGIERKHNWDIEIGSWFVEANYSEYRYCSSFPKILLLTMALVYLRAREIYRKHTRGEFNPVGYWLSQLSVPSSCGFFDKSK